jgi:hypothetical protein
VIDQTPLPSAAELLAALRIGTTREKRGRPRREFVCEAILLAMHIQGVVHAPIQTRDISVGGMGFTTGQKLSVGEKCVICVAAGDVHRLILARVAHMNLLVGGRYKCGVHFLQVVASNPGPIRLPPGWQNKLQPEVKTPVTH